MHCAKSTSRPCSGGPTVNSESEDPGMLDSFIALEGGSTYVHSAAVKCDMVLHYAFGTRHVRTTSISVEVRHGVTSSVSYETSKT